MIKHIVDTYAEVYLNRVVDSSDFNVTAIPNPQYEIRGVFRK